MRGRKTGGRKKGVPNKVTLQKEAAVAASGLTPLDYMLSVLRSQADPEANIKDYIAHAMLRMEAAKAAAPYVHPRLASVELSGNKDKPLTVNVLRFSDTQSSGTGTPPKQYEAEAASGYVEQKEQRAKT
jgi:hypothetical protein